MKNTNTILGNTNTKQGVANTRVFELLLLALSAKYLFETFQCKQKDELHQKTIVDMS